MNSKIQSSPLKKILFKTSCAEHNCNLFASLIYNINECVFTVDAHCKIRFVNDSFQKVFGYTAEEALGNSPFFLFPLENTLIDQQDIVTSSEWNGKTIFIKKNGKKFNGFLTISPLFSWESIQTGRVFRINTDGYINRLESELFESDSTLKILFGNILQTIILIDKNFHIKWYNKKANDLFKNFFDKDIRVETLITDYLNLEFLPMFYKNFDRALNGEKVITEREIKRRNKLHYWFEVNYLPVFDEQGIVSSVVLNISETTEHKSALESLRRHDSILEAVNFAAEKFLKSSELGNVVTEVLERLGRSANVQRVYLIENYKDYEEESRLMCKQYEWIDNSILDDNLCSIKLNLSYKKYGLERWEKSLNEGKIISGVTRYFPAQEKKYLESKAIKSVLIVPVFAGQSFWGYLGFDDCLNERKWTITEIDAIKAAAQILGAEIQRIRFEEELIVAKDKAEKSDRLKSEFLAQMSHEIRTPINAILSFTSLLKSELENKIPDELFSSFDIIDSGGRRLIRTIDMILNMSQFQTGSFENIPTLVNLAGNFIENIIMEFLPLARKKNLELNFSKKIESSIVLIDSYTISQVFINLIDNALKFTTNGSINIILYKNRNGLISVDVKDTGIGISEDYLQNLFTPFSQEEMGYTRKYEGNGLGLALVKKYLEINNAEIFVQSKKNVGSVFTVVFNENNKSIAKGIKKSTNA